ncbi:hypothetical protein GCM10025858_06760 [Alicyclobacillus sacchari]|nr:hypothetical protein GCM10025858_06760 [Alicyclobacillus sacchari]
MFVCGVGRWWRLVAVVMVALVAAGVGVFFGHGTNSDTASSPGTQMYGTSATARGGVDNAAIGAGDEEPGTIEVDVHGDVRHPGVVQVLSTARVGDAIRAAGAFFMLRTRRR